MGNEQNLTDGMSVAEFQDYKTNQRILKLSGKLDEIRVIVDRYNRSYGLAREIQEVLDR